MRKAGRTAEIQPPKAYLTGVFGHAGTWAPVKPRIPDDLSPVQQKAFLHQWAVEEHAARLQHNLVTRINLELGNRRWTHQKLAQEAGLSVVVIGRILRGEMTVTLRHIARMEIALRTSLTDLSPPR